jgi:dolichol kinase
MLWSPAYRAEVSRKVLHLASAAIPTVYLLVERPLMLCLLLPCVLIAIVVETLRFASPRFAAGFRTAVGFMVRAVEWQRLTGATYVLVASILAVYLFPKPVAIAALFIMSVSDSAASLMGITFGRTRFLGKSLAGSGSFFVTAVAILGLHWPAAKGVGVLVACVATLAEAIPTVKLGLFELNDNLTVPLLTGAALVALLP